MTERVSSTLQRMNVFWDIENTNLPRELNGHILMESLRLFAKSQQCELSSVHAISHLMDDRLLADLQDAGISLQVLSQDVKSDAADLAILAELLKVIIDHPYPQKIVLITGDGDFSSIVNTLRNRNFDVILFYPSEVGSTHLKQSATLSYSWVDFLELYAIPCMPLSQRAAIITKFQDRRLRTSGQAKKKPKIQQSTKEDVIQPNQWLPPLQGLTRTQMKVIQQPTIIDLTGKKKRKKRKK
eukprot:TRINITY_DN4386_c0_g1_i2.p1 TRINITY_DN4386_c0_g1~~TRINITY_DN4386_c0_g1_i2.p1  ORF type:complete len:250 (+),score=64.34 TRINITY_DN4386_c0_g1_i2:30-752(+)